MLKLKSRIYNAKKGQAALELSIFCTIVLMAFSMMLFYGQRLMEQQKVKMETFRAALDKAYNKNAGVSYTLKRDLRLSNLMGGYGQGQYSTVGSSASAMWAKGMAGTQTHPDRANLAYYRINEVYLHDDDTGLPRYKKLVTTLTGEESEVIAPVSVYKEEAVRSEQYSSIISKDENPSRIINTSSGKLKDKIVRKIHFRFDLSDDPDPAHENNEVAPDYVYEGESYSHEGDSYTIDDAYSGTQHLMYNPDKDQVEYVAGDEDIWVNKTQTWVTDQVYE